MPRHSAAEAMPMPEPQKDEEIEELPSDHLKEEPPAVPQSKDMKEALESLQELHETREDDAMKREREEASAAASTEIKKSIEDRRKSNEASDKAAEARLRRSIGAAPLHDMSEDATLIEPPPIPSADKGWSGRAAADIEAKKKTEGEEKRKKWPKWMKKLWDALG